MINWGTISISSSFHYAFSECRCWKESTKNSVFQSLETKVLDLNTIQCAYMRLGSHKRSRCLIFTVSAIFAGIIVQMLFFSFPSLPFPPPPSPLLSFPFLSFSSRTSSSFAQASWMLGDRVWINLFADWSN